MLFRSVSTSCREADVNLLLTLLPFILFFSFFSSLSAISKITCDSLQLPQLKPDNHKATVHGRFILCSYLKPVHYSFHAISNLCFAQRPLNNAKQVGQNKERHAPIMANGKFPLFTCFATLNMARLCPSKKTGTADFPGKTIHTSQR